MKGLMLHLKKKSNAREKEREIRDPTTLLPLTMITCLPLAASFRYPFVKPLVSMGWTIPNLLSITRRKPIVRLTLARSGTWMIGVPTPIVMVWPPWQSRVAALLQANLSFPTSTKQSVGIS
jgi:hypothetical protein